MTITGKVIKKEKSNLKVNLFVFDDFSGSVFCVQVRSKNIIKLVEIDTNSRVQIKCTNEISKATNTLILNEIVII